MTPSSDVARRGSPERPGPETAGPPPRQRGFALPAVLWILVLVGAIAASYLSAARSERRSVAHAVERAEARWAARAAFARGTAELEAVLGSPRVSERFRATGDTLLAARGVEANGATATVALVDARSRLHLNRAEPRRVAALLSALGVPPPRARRLADHVADWRDPDDRARRGDSEAAAYAARGLPVRPRDGPFATVREVGGVLGVDPATAAALRSHLTVVGDGRVNLNTAPVPVLSTLPGVDLAAARALAEARAGRPYSGLQDVLGALPTDAARRVRIRREPFEERAAYDPRHAELLAEAVSGAPTGTARVRAEVELEGGESWRVVRTVER